MAYYLVDNFRGGVDRRRNVAAPVAQSMHSITNAFVNKGGEIEKRKQWTKLTDPDGLLDAFAALAPQGGFGPVPTFARNAVNLHVGVSGVSGYAGSFWTTNGAGLVGDFGNYIIGVYPDPAITSPTGVYYHFSTMFQGNLTQNIFSRIIPTNIGPRYVSGSATYTVNPGELVPITGGLLPNRSGAIRPEGGSGSYTINGLTRFDSTFYICPNIYGMAKSQTGAFSTDTGTGYGLIDLNGKGASIGRPYSIDHYYDQIAIFFDSGIQFWSVDSDPANFQYRRSIVGESIIAHRAKIPYGSGDILYLTGSGIRSLSARDSSNFAATTDLGSPIDDLVAEIIALLSPRDRLMQIARVLGETGQALFFCGKAIMVYSHYPSAGVRAWTVYDTPGAPDIIMDAASIGDSVCVRTHANEIYIYGNTDLSANHYDDTMATVVTPYFGVDDPYKEKIWKSVDLTCQGTWEVEFSVDPKNEAWVSLGEVTDWTHLQGDIGIDVTSNLIAFRLTTSSPQPAKLSQIGIHYAKTGVEG